MDINHNRNEARPVKMASPHFYQNMLKQLDTAFSQLDERASKRTTDELELDQQLRFMLKQIESSLTHLSRVRMIVYLPLIIAIDGRAAAGKTTLAAALAQLLDLSLFHMDDFYLPPERRTEERFAKAGGNIDFERFRKDVLLPLRAAEPFSYQALIPHEWSYSEARHISKTDMVIVEGAYALHEALRDFYRADLSFFIDVDSALQLERILLRNGEAAVQQFVERWIPYEEKYIASMKPDDFAKHHLRLGPTR